VQIENAILNLAVNARDAMHGRGTLTIATGCTTLAESAVEHCAPGDHVTIAVTDTGTGMEPAIAERVFEPFFTTKPVGKGTGLGLSQIFGMVRQIGGGIAIDTAPGRGTTVTLYLPRDTSAPVAAAAEPAALVTGKRDALSILVVEDDPRVLAATMGALEELGHQAVSCDDPLAAPAMLEHHPEVDLVISDVLMPRQTGPEMVAGLTARFPHLAVLFVTGFAGEANAETFGDHVLLRKPFTLAKLEAAIDTAMARRPDVQAIAAE
jgi:CheY-like chemotaxis protein